MRRIQRPSFPKKKKIPPGSKVQKRTATKKNKKIDIINYRKLKQTITNGLVHRVFEFQRSNWFTKYIHLIIKMRENAVIDFEKDFFKFLNNVVIGKIQ